MIRRATVLDISALTIMLDTMHKETEINVPKISSMKLISKINELVHNGLVFVSIKDNKIQGSIAGQICADWWSEEKYVGDVWFYVFKDQRKSDVAKKLIEAYIKTAKDVNMKKGDSIIKVSAEFVDHYTKLGYQIIDNKKNISVAKETEKIIKEIKKAKE